VTHPSTKHQTGVLEALRTANVTRLRRWHGETEWSGADWSNAMCGEAGEAANVVKKLRRHETGLGEVSANTPPPDELLTALADELADVVAYLDLLAHHYGIDLATAVAAKFNRVSERNGFPERLDEAS
jgi:NTP pyrophosphatase (non-canonical NTP hydrolase)